ncbi:hypothetical protein AVEN_201581-1 [Araneus ventricosus]|uniref:Uncharacterized protein n=1 Tax=Araneus ventricosus TaxID=182803 RepID=A0A4Y2FF88_ARAVE|nr:hypothetical protein AVEN_201581-1 [Araneus ventricosus]
MRAQFEVLIFKVTSVRYCLISQNGHLVENWRSASRIEIRITYLAAMEITVDHQDDNREVQKPTDWPVQMDIFLTNVEVTVKRLSETRWNSHYETVKSVFKSFKKILDAIEELCDASETIKTTGAAQTLLPAMCDFSFSCLWNNVLKEVNHVQKYFQIIGITFYKSLYQNEKSRGLFKRQKKFPC